MTGKHTKTWFVWALAFASLASTACIAAALTVPDSRFAGAFNLAPVHEARANKLSASEVPEDISRAQAETMLTLRQAPANSTAWLRLAYLDRLSQGEIRAQGNLALSRSYAVAPYGPDDTAWRLAFAFNNWAALTVSNRELAIEELSYIAAQRSPKVSKVKDEVLDPVGTLALHLTLDTAQRNAASDER